MNRRREGIDRRTWLAAAIASVYAAAAGRADTPASDAPPTEEQEIEAIRAQAREVGLGELRVARTPHYTAVGDAAESFIRLSLRDCEGVAADYLDHYRSRGFAVDPPSGRMIVVALADDRAFARYLGMSGPNPNIGGIYDKDNNRLHVYDYRQLGPQAPIRAGHANLLSLAHEATHQLTFNTGLLDRRRDVPLCLIEGLATYGEVRKFDGPSPPGAVNSLRLDNLARIRRQGLDWIPLETLLADDDLIRGKAGGGKLLLGYAQAWLLTHYLMNDTQDLPRFRRYLEAIRPRTDATRRLDDAREHLGDLRIIDERLQAYFLALLRREP